MIKRIIVVLAALFLFAEPALAAKCYVKEYASMGTATNGSPQVANEPAVTDQTAVDFSGGAAQSAAFNSSTRYIRVWCDAQASFLVGTNPTATNAMSPLSASLPEYFGVKAGQKISVVANP